MELVLGHVVVAPFLVLGLVGWFPVGQLVVLGRACRYMVVAVAGAVLAVSVVSLVVVGGVPVVVLV